MRFLKYKDLYVNADIIDCMHVTCCKTRESDDTIWGFLLGFNTSQENPVINLDWWVENYEC